MCTERRGDSTGRHARTRGVEKQMDDSRRRDLEWKTDVGEARFIMARRRSRADKWRWKRTVGAGTEALF